MKWKQPKVYAVKHKSEEIRAASRSGGIFTALSDQVLADGEYGENKFNEIKNAIEWKQTKLEDSMQQPFIAPFPKPNNREQVWKDFFCDDFQKFAIKYGGYGIGNKIKRKIRSILKK